MIQDNIDISFVPIKKLSITSQESVVSRYS